MDEAQDRVRGDRRPRSQQFAQRVFHEFLSVVLRRFQNPQVLFHRLDFLASLAQLVVGLPKHQRREHVFDILIVAKRAGLADQRVDHVPIIDLHLALAELAWHPLHAFSRVPQFDFVLLHPRLDLQSDQFTVHRIGVLPQSQQAVGTDAQVVPRIRRQPRVGQRAQVRKLAFERQLSISVALGHHAARPRIVVSHAAEVAPAAQV